MIVKKRILFCISSLGLGHAYRELSLIRRLAERNDLHLFSSNGALKWLREELKHSCVKFYSQPSYPPLQRGSGLSYPYYLFRDSIATFRAIRKEHGVIDTFVREKGIHLIISDCQYGAYSRRVPSFAVSHQIRFVVPKTYRIALPVVVRYNRRALARFDRVFIPDYPGTENLTGNLSHNPTVPRLKHDYVGVLSSVPHLNVRKNIDYLFIFSGYLREHHNSFVARLLDQARGLVGKKVFVLGDVSHFEHRNLGHGIETYTYASAALRVELLNRAKTVISRSGYTTVMDLVELGTPGILVATPGQTEQVYLARWLSGRGYFVSYERQDLVDLQDSVYRLQSTRPFIAPSKTDSTLKQIERVIATYL
jgi:UDP-N-acetylglucosamine transferase subunit ALG13